MRQIMSCACVMHIHGLGTKSMSRSPICFNELGSWGERLNFSFEFQTEKVKGALLCQREREREGGTKGRAMVRRQQPKPPARLQPQKYSFFPLRITVLHCKHTRAYGPLDGPFFFFCLIIYTVCFSVQEINIAMHSSFYYLPS